MNTEKNNKPRNLRGKLDHDPKIKNPNGTLTADLVAGGVLVVVQGECARIAHEQLEKGCYVKVVDGKLVEFEASRRDLSMDPARQIENCCCETAQEAQPNGRPLFDFPLRVADSGGAPALFDHADAVIAHFHPSALGRARAEAIARLCNVQAALDACDQLG